MLEIIWMKPSELQEYERNNKDHRDNLTGIIESLRLFGWQMPIIVNRDRVIISGHGRWQAAKKLKMKTIPVVISELNEQQETEFRIIDNVTQAQGKIDFQEVAKDLRAGHVHTKYLNEMKDIISEIDNIEPLKYETIQSIRKKLGGMAND